MEITIEGVGFGDADVSVDGDVAYHLIDVDKPPEVYLKLPGIAIEKLSITEMNLIMCALYRYRNLEPDTPRSRRAEADTLASKLDPIYQAHAHLVASAGAKFMLVGHYTGDLIGYVTRDKDVVAQVTALVKGNQ